MAQHSDDLPSHSNWITAEDFEYFCFNLTREFLSYKEPIPEYNTRNNALLESALASPMHPFDGKLLYPTISQQAAILFYSMIKNHPFENGNKRIAVMTLLIFLRFNNKWIKIPNDLLYNLAKGVAKSFPKERKKVLEDLNALIEEYMIEQIT